MVTACTATSGPDTSDSQTTEAPRAVAESSDDEQAVSDGAGEEAPPNPEPVDPDHDDADRMDSKCEALDRVRLVRSESRPGGRRLHLQLTDGDGVATVPEVAQPCLVVGSERLGPLESVVSATPPTGGATLIVARWATADAAASRDAIDALIAELGATERVAVWAWSDELRQVVGATSDRALIARRLDAVWAADDAAVLDAAEAGDIAAEEWEDFNDDALLGARSVVFVAPTLDLGDRPDVDRDVVTDHWIVNSGDGGRVIALDGGSASDAGAAVGVRIAEDAVQPLTVVDVCDDGDALDLTFTAGDRELRSVGVGDAAIEHVGAQCHIDSGAAVGSVETVASFDPPQRAVFDDAVAVADELSGRDRFDAGGDGATDPEWSGSLSFDGGATTAPFEASFRGQSSIECKRRNWSVDLEGGDARHPYPGASSDEFVLASLCNDEGYVNTLIGSAVMSDLGIWSQAVGTTPFAIDDESRGVYAVIEHPVEDLRHENSRVVTVLRRRYDVIGVQPDVEYVADLTARDESTIVNAYDRLIDTARDESGIAMVEALRGRFDLDQYLRWTAVMSLLGSGDHIDELYFVGTESVDADHEPVVYFQVNGWDPDDLYAECHRDGRFAIDDPTGLLSCTESLLDAELFSDPAVLELYVEQLESVLHAWTPERFAATAGDAAADITRHFGDADVVAALPELGDAGIDQASSTTFVESTAASISERFDARHAELIEGIASYRTAN